jgi:nucleoside 2-deoxyribosyltransferase
MKKKIVYLANPYGFSLQQKELLLPIKEKIESFGYEVWEPFERNDQIDFANPDWAYKIGQADKEDVKNCDIIFAMVNGNPPDEGVMIELGMAIALEKEVYLFRDDFRKCSDSEKYPLNLMLFTGLDSDSWKEHYFTSVDKINF